VAFLVGFFLKNGFHSRRTLWLALVSGFPVLCSLILWPLRAVLERQGIPVVTLFPQMSFYLYLHFLLPLMAVFVGSAVIADEVEERTLPYLLMQPVRRRNMMLAKTFAGMLTLGILMCASLGLTYTVLTGGEGIAYWIAHIPGLLQAGAVLLLGTLVYIPLFGIMGGVLKRAVLIGLLFTFGWENTVAFFPGNVKLLTVAYYLHTLFPKVARQGSESIENRLIATMMPQTSIHPVLAVGVLLLFSMIFTGVLMMLPEWKEYRLEQTE
jgi:ABC-type transport system involved in multi-copper enzyme maturation permease subunit